MNTVATVLPVEALASGVPCARRARRRGCVARDNGATKGTASNSSLRAAGRVGQTAVVTAGRQPLPALNGITGLIAATLSAPSRTHACYVGVL